MTYDIYPCDLDPFGECPKPEYARDCANCKGWTEEEADNSCSDINVNLGGKIHDC